MKATCIIAAVVVAVFFVIIATLLVFAMKEPDDKLFDKIMQANVVLCLLALGAGIVLYILGEAVIL